MKLLIVLTAFLILSGIGFAAEKTEKEEIFPVVMVEIKKDVSIKEFYNTNSLIRSRMFYEDFLKRFAKINEIIDENLDILPIGIYFIPVDGVFFKNAKTGIYPVTVINAEPGMTANEFYQSNSLINRKMSKSFFLERFAEYQGIPNKEKEFRKLKPSAWIMPVPNVFYWTSEGIKSPLSEMTFKPVKGDLYLAEFWKEIPEEVPKTPETPSTITLLAYSIIGVIVFLLITFLFSRLITFLFSRKKTVNKNKTSYI